MSLIKWNRQKDDPLSEFFGPNHPFLGLTLFPELKGLTSSASESWLPAVDVEEEKDRYIVRADLPGLKKEDIDLSVENGALRIRGERKSEVEKKEKNVHRIERSYGQFVRTFNLGSDVDESKVKAEYKDGVLEVILPKSQTSASRRIAIEGK